MKSKKKTNLGFRQAFTYILDVLCYSYYVKHKNLVSDQTFDELEKLYCKIFKEISAPNRGIEVEAGYSTGVKVVYGYIKGGKK